MSFKNESKSPKLYGNPKLYRNPGSLFVYRLAESPSFWHCGGLSVFDTRNAAKPALAPCPMPQAAMPPCHHAPNPLTPVARAFFWNYLFFVCHRPRLDILMSCCGWQGGTGLEITKATKVYRNLLLVNRWGLLHSKWLTPIKLMFSDLHTFPLACHLAGWFLANKWHDVMPHGHMTHV